MPRRSSRPLSYFVFLVLLPLLFTTIVLVGYQQAEKHYITSGIRSLEKQMNTVLHLITVYTDEAKKSQLSKPDAQERIKEILAGPKREDGTRDSSKVDMTLGPGDYLFGINSNGIIVMHPYLEGHNLFQQQNSQGRYIVQELISKKENILYYQWQNPNDPWPRSKITIIRYFPEWDWYICFSTYEENFFLLFKQVKYLLIFLVAGSYIVAAILFYLAKRKEKVYRKTERVSEELVETNQSILKSLAVALEERDSYTSGHSQRVAYYMRHIAKNMGLPEEVQDVIYTGGLLHDIGKIGIGDSILLKAGRLTEPEYHTIKNHPVRGEALLRKLYAQTTQQDKKKIEMILSITRSHHERYDGMGYPDQLTGDNIPLVARIAAVADSFDAMTSNRAYRRGLSFSKATGEIIKCTGTQFCPQVVQAFLQSITEETFHNAHHLSREDQLLIDPVDDLKQESVISVNSLPVM